MHRFARWIGVLVVALLLSLIWTEVAMAATVLLSIVPGSGIFVDILNAALALGIPVAATYVFTELTKFVLKAQTWSTFAKRVLVFVWGTLIAGINHALGLTLPEAWGMLSQPDVAIILTTGLAYLAHQILNKTPPAPA